METLRKPDQALREVTAIIPADAVVPGNIPHADAHETARKKFGEDIAFGVQQTFACWATDFIDPYVGEKIQERLGKGKVPTGSTWVGEFVGDTAAFFAFLGVQKFAPGVTRTLHRATRKLFDRQLGRMGEKELHRWAAENDIAHTSPEYKAKMEEWKEFQADNIAKSSIVSASSVALNVCTQRGIMRNSNRIGVITVAKITGAIITVAGMLGLRFTLPRTMQKLDEETSRRYFTPLIRETQKVMGAEVDAKLAERNHAHRHEASSHSERLAARSDDKVTQYAR